MCIKICIFPVSTCIFNIFCIRIIAIEVRPLRSSKADRLFSANYYHHHRLVSFTFSFQINMTQFTNIQMILLLGTLLCC